MNSGMQKRLYEMEVTPPAAVWEKLSVNIDEINDDNLLAKKILSTELSPPAGVWEKIGSTINFFEEKSAPKKGRVLNLRRLAAAAVLIGLIATGWILFNNNNKTSAGLSKVEPSQQKTSTDTNTTAKKAENTNSIGILPEQSIAANGDASSGNIIISTSVTPRSRNKKNNFSGRRNDILVQPATAQFASLNESLGKSFNEPIDDLALVTSDQNYLTMVNANGRLVKIPAQLASLAPHLQDKPISEDYYEVLFGEGTYWKETLNEWRKKLVSAPTSGDAFTSFVEMLKSVQNK